LKTIAWHWIAVRCAVFLPTHDAAQAHDTLTMTQSGPPVERTRHPVEWPREVQSIIGATENPGTCKICHYRWVRAVFIKQSTSF